MFRPRSLSKLQVINRRATRGFGAAALVVPGLRQICQDRENSSINIYSTCARQVGSRGCSSQALYSADFGCASLHQTRAPGVQL